MCVKVALTGATGFVGRHVLAELGRHEAEIVAVTRDAKRLRNAGGRVVVVEMDIAAAGRDCLAQIGNPDVLIHLAWDGLPNYRSLRHFEAELPGQYAFLSALVAAGLPSLFVAGTCFEYGMQSGALTEDAKPCPCNPYGFAKDSLRRQLEFLKGVKPFNLTWARLFYMYGEGQPGTSLYPQLCEAVSRGDEVFDMSGGEQLRDYLPVAEVARMIVQLAISGRDNGTVNLCSGRPVSVRTLVEKWLKEHDSEMKLNLGCYPYPDYEPMAFWGDATKLHETLGSNQ